MDPRACSRLVSLYDPCLSEKPRGSTARIAPPSRFETAHSASLSLASSEILTGILEYALILHALVISRKTLIDLTSSFTRCSMDTRIMICNAATHRKSKSGTEHLEMACCILGKLSGPPPVCLAREEDPCLLPEHSV